MKSKIIKSIGITVLCLAILVGNVLAFSLGTTDGIWGRIDSTGGTTLDASCGNYGAVTSASYTLWDAMGIIYNVNVGPGGEDERFVRNANICTGDIDGDIAFATNNPAGWTRTGSAIWTGLGSHTNTCSSTTGLFISEYVYDQIDGNVNDRLGVEIFNKTGASINLATGNYSLLFFTDDRNFTKVDLSGTVANNDVFVVVNNAAAGSTSNEDQTIANNDDYRTVVLIQNYTYRVINAIDTDGWPETVQANSLTDENQVRYGSPSGSTGCPASIAGFDTQSGFGFEGQIDTSFEPADNQYFPVGRFCHYNNPISTPGNALDTVPLYLTVNDIGCPVGETYVPILPAIDNDLDFEFRVNLDETPNSATPCLYGTSSPGWPGGSSNPNIAGDVGPNRSGCADMVSFTASSSSQSFKCRISTVPLIEQEYTVSIVGFTPTTAGNECPDVPIGTIQFNQFYTAEYARNCYCVYAAYTRGQITPVVLQNLSAIGTDDGIMISWETVTETNNLGFNIMRAESKDGEQDQINSELIMSDVAPGDPFGSVYEFLDDTAVKGVTYFYWLIDVPLDGSANGIHGPISAERN